MRVGFHELTDLTKPARFDGDMDQRYEVFHLAYFVTDHDSVESRTGEVLCVRTLFISDQTISVEFVGDAPGVIVDLGQDDFEMLADDNGTTVEEMLAYELPDVPWSLKRHYITGEFARTPPIRDAFAVFLANPRASGTSNADEG